MYEVINVVTGEVYGAYHTETQALAVQATLESEDWDLQGFIAVVNQDKHCMV